MPVDEEKEDKTAQEQTQEEPKVETEEGSTDEKTAESEQTTEVTDKAGSETKSEKTTQGADSKPGEESEAPPTWAPEWAKKRINRLTWEKGEKDRENQRLRQELDTLKNVGSTTTSATEKTEERTQPTENLTEKEITRRAEALVAQREFDARANAVYSKGSEEYSDWEKAVTNLGAMGIVGPEADPQFLATVTKLGSAHQIIYHLGKNPDVASRLAGLPLAEMAMELKSLEIELAKPSRVKVSNAPTPIKTVTGTARKDFDLADPDTDMKEWLEKRSKTARKRW